MIAVGLDSKQLRDFVIRPVLQRLAPRIPFSEAAVSLVLGTALAESGLVFIDQIDRASKPGPAYGLWQMEASTFLDHIERAPYSLWTILNSYGPVAVTFLHGNLFLGAAMCRLLYWHAPEKLPDASDAEGMAALWKLRYNTPKGAGSVQGAYPAFAHACMQTLGSAS